MIAESAQILCWCRKDGSRGGEQTTTTTFVFAQLVGNSTEIVNPLSTSIEGFHSVPSLRLLAGASRKVNAHPSSLCADTTSLEALKVRQGGYWFDAGQRRTVAQIEISQLSETGEGRASGHGQACQIREFAQTHNLQGQTSSYGVHPSSSLSRTIRKNLIACVSSRGPFSL